MSEIKCLRLVTGEDIIAEYTYNAETGVVTIKNPVQVSMVPSRGNEQPNFGFLPFPLVSNDKVINMSGDKVVFVCTPAEEFEKQYNTIFGNIITPSSKIIV